MINSQSCSFFRFKAVVAFICIFLTENSFGQVFNASNFPCQVSTGAVLDNMAGSTNATYSDSSPTGLISFGSGFTFWYAGTNYTGLCMSPDGWVKLGATGSTQSAANFNSTTNYPIIAPYWSDLTHIQPLKYKMVGTAPNRTFIVSWVSDGNYLYGASFQLWLHETTGQIDFVYGTVYSNTAHYSIGLGAILGNQKTFINLATDTFPAQTLMYYNGIYNLDSLAIQSGTEFSFIPVMGNVTAPQNFQFTNVSAGCLAFSWQDASTTEAYYKVFRSTDNINFTFMKAIASTSTLTTGATYQCIDTNLSPQTHYYYKVNDYSFCSAFTDSIVRDTVTAMPSLQGLKMIPGDYPSIYEALEAIRCERLSGPIVLELQSNYSDSGEIFPLRVDQYLYNTTQNSITIRPSLAATGLIISTGSSEMFHIDQADGITIDGRPGGIGSARELTLVNNALNGIVVNYINDAKNEHLSNLNILGSNTNVNSGSVVIGTSNQVSGNDSIVIDSCNFTNSSIGLVSNHIYAKGTSGKTNDHVDIINCLFSNSFTNVTNDSSAAIQILAANDDWTISRNSFFDDSAIVANGCIYSILIKDISGLHFDILNNSFGGRAAFASGLPMNLSAKSGAFIYLSAPSCTARISGNIIRNISLYQTAINGSYRAMSLDGGNVEVDANLVGRIDTIDDIVIRSQTSQSFDGIMTNGLGHFKVHNNVIAGIRINGIGTANGGMVMLGVYGDTSIAYENQIGSPDFIQSIYSSTTGFVKGISCNGTVVDNRICHLWKDSPITGIDNALYGIIGTGKIINNEIWGFYTNAYSGNPIRGIKVQGANNEVKISENEIYAFTIDGVQTQYIYAIEYIGSNIQDVTIDRNFIHHISVHGNTISQVDGIFAQGTSRILNNMISLGYCMDGNISGTTREFYGIEVFSGTFKVFFNSIYIGGADSVLGAVDGGIYLRYGTNNDSIFNNIVFIDRTNAVTFGFVDHNPIMTYSQSSYIPHINYNLYFITAPQNYWANSSTSFPAWQALGYDLNSNLGVPGFINAQGDTQNVNLHIAGSSPVEANGYYIPWITTDIDSDSRAANTPTDIGADAGNFFITATNEEALSTLSIFPNPAKSEITVYGMPEEFKGEIEIRDISGRLIISKNSSELRKSGKGCLMDISALESGIYFAFVIEGQINPGTMFIKQ
jgi:hypothetical protein